MRLNAQNGLASTIAPLLAILFAMLFLLQDASLVRGQNGSAVASGTDVRANTATHPFEPAEELIYLGEFSRALLKKVDVADFRFTVNREQSLQKDSGQDQGSAPYLLKLTGDVSSKGIFSKLFNLRFREQIESIVEPNSFTVRRTKKVDEQGKRARISESTYLDGRVVWTEQDPNNLSRESRTTSAAFSGQVQDVLSAIYYLRTRPLEVGKTFEIAISDSGNVYQVPVRVVERKRKSTVLGRVETLRIDPQVFGDNRMLAGDGQFSIWLTNDSRRIPVSARIKMKYGTFDITLRKVIQNPALQKTLASIVVK
jgi:Protein of unknown function (DUF3108)